MYCFFECWSVRKVSEIEGGMPLGSWSIVGLMVGVAALAK